jgi:hypothetical protein
MEVLTKEYELYLMRLSALSPKVKAVEGYTYSKCP